MVKVFKKIIVITFMIIVAGSLFYLTCHKYVDQFLFSRLLGFGYMSKSEQPIKSYSGKFEYLQLSSPEKMVCTIAIYDYLKGYPHFNSILTTFFRDYDMRAIAWGNSDDLFFCSRDVGVYCYRFENGKWNGPFSVVMEEDKNYCAHYILFDDGKKQGELNKDAIPEQVLKTLNHSDD